MAEQREYVMVIDDDPAMGRETCRILRDAGYRAEHRPGSFGAIGHVLREGPDVVLVDVEMPGVGGQRLAEFIRKTPGADRAFVILYSAKNADALDKLVRSSGAMGAIAKRGDEADFMQQFELLMHSARSQIAVS